ncbi:tyrosine-type recombinase/integrase [Kribbella sp. NPDC023855]|uniref:tyrosine-type recombinase/integrase n=1 Tax=Kribbella sp. NPDC023855 TaxID=3154698 RepID=UPI0034056587
MPASSLEHELIEEWSDWMRAAGAAPNTIRTRTDGVKLLWYSAQTEDPVQIPTKAIVRWLAKCNSKWTRCTYASSARTWFRFLVDQGHLEVSPMDRLAVPPTPRSVPRPASSDVVRETLAVCGRRAHAYIILGTFLGLRVHEIAKVRGDHFDDGWYFVTGKGDVGAAIPTHPLVEQLRKGFPSTGPWFPGVEGGHVRATTVTKTVTRAFKKAGYQVTAHQLRHWYGTHAQRVGKDSRATQHLLRHANLASTQIYTEVADRHLQEIVRRLAV